MDGVMPAVPRTPSPPPVPSPADEMSAGGHSNSGHSSPPLHQQHQQQNCVTTVLLGGVPIVCLHMDGKERLCLAQISNTLLKEYSYNEIHNRRVALGITCVQCTPVQLEILRRAGAMPVSSRRCGMITKREAERLVKSFLEDHSPPVLPDNFAFNVGHTCGWGCKGQFIPARYNSSRAKCIKCCFCAMFFSPNKFIFHFHRTPEAKYRHPDAANFNSWRRHLELDYPGSSTDDMVHAWEDVKAMFNGGSRKKMLSPGSPKSDSDMCDRDVSMMLSPKRARLQDDLASSTPSSHHMPQSNMPPPMFSFPPGPFINSAALSSGSGHHPPFLPPPPPTHPAFPFFNNQQHHHQQQQQQQQVQPPCQDLIPVAAAATMDKMNLAELWKNKAPAAYCHPFNLFWAKNMANIDNMNPFRGMLDTDSLMARDNHDANKASSGRQEASSKANRFSAFKPVGLFGGTSFESQIEEVVNTVVGSPGMSATPSPPLSDDIEPDIDVTEGMDEMLRHSSPPPQQPLPTPPSNQQQSQQKPHQSKNTENNPITCNNNNNEEACPGHITKKDNAKNYSVEFLASTGRKDCTEDILPQKTLPAEDEKQDSSAKEVVPATSMSADVDIHNIYNMSKEQLQSQLIQIIAKRDRLEKSVQSMKESKCQNQYETEAGMKQEDNNIQTFKDSQNIMPPTTASHL